MKSQRGTAPMEAAAGVAPTKVKPWLRRTEEAAGWCFVIAGLALALIRHSWGDPPGFPNAELGAAAFGAPYSTLGLLAVLASRGDRLALMAFASVPLLFMSTISVVTLPLLPIAGFLVARALTGRAGARQRRRGRAGLCLSFVLPAMPVLAFGYLVFHQDPRSWRTADSIHGTSDIITLSESALSLGAAAVAVAVSLVWIVRDP